KRTAWGTLRGSRMALNKRPDSMHVFRPNSSWRTSMMDPLGRARSAIVSWWLILFKTPPVLLTPLTGGARKNPRYGLRTKRYHSMHGVTRYFSLDNDILGAASVLSHERMRTPTGWAWPDTATSPAPSCRSV